MDANKRNLVRGESRNTAFITVKEYPVDTKPARTFVAIASSGRFMRAAERLHVARTTVSARIGRWRSSFVELCLSAARPGEVLTPAGEQFLRHALRMIRLWWRYALALVWPGCARSRGT